MFPNLFLMKDSKGKNKSVTKLAQKSFETKDQIGKTKKRREGSIQKVQDFYHLNDTKYMKSENMGEKIFQKNKKKDKRKVP